MRVVVALVVVVAIVGGGVAWVYGIGGRPETVVAWVYGIVGRPVAAVQPIRFNHELHVNEAGAECIDCHTDAETGVFAGLPGKDACFDCHDPYDEDVTHPQKVKLLSYAESDEEIPWVRVAVTKPDVFFSHRRHVTSAGLDCLECHPDQPTLTAPPATVRLVMTMDECIECHQQNRASSDCLACHR